MRLINLKIIGMMMLSCLAVQVHAGGDSDYPAAYFEPVITYQDPELISSVADESPAPAQVDSENTTEDSAPEQDNRYPAAYFEPVIVFQDSDYIASEKSVPVSKRKSANSATSSSNTKKSSANDWPDAASSRVSASNSGSFPFLGLLIVFGLFGYVYWAISKEKPSEISENSGDVIVDDSGESVGNDTVESVELEGNIESRG